MAVDQAPQVTPPTASEPAAAVAAAPADAKITPAAAQSSDAPPVQIIKQAADASAATALPDADRSEDSYEKYGPPADYQNLVAELDASPATQGLMPQVEAEQIVGLQAGPFVQTAKLGTGRLFLSLRSGDRASPIVANKIGLYALKGPDHNGNWSTDVLERSQEDTGALDRGNTLLTAAGEQVQRLKDAPVVAPDGGFGTQMERARKWVEAPRARWVQVLKWDTEITITPSVYTPAPKVAPVAAAAAPEAPRPVARIKHALLKQARNGQWYEGTVGSPVKPNRFGRFDPFHIGLNGLRALHLAPRPELDTTVHWARAEAPAAAPQAAAAPVQTAEAAPVLAKASFTFEPLQGVNLNAPHRETLIAAHVRLDTVPEQTAMAKARIKADRLTRLRSNGGTRPAMARTAKRMSAHSVASAQSTPVIAPAVKAAVADGAAKAKENAQAAVAAGTATAKHAVQAVRAAAPKIAAQAKDLQRKLKQTADIDAANKALAASLAAIFIASAVIVTLANRRKIANFLNDRKNDQSAVPIGTASTVMPRPKDHELPLSLRPVTKIPGIAESFFNLAKNAIGKKAKLEQGAEQPAAAVKTAPKPFDTVRTAMKASDAATQAGLGPFEVKEVTLTADEDAEILAKHPDVKFEPAVPVEAFVNPRAQAPIRNAVDKNVLETAAARAKSGFAAWARSVEAVTAKPAKNAYVYGQKVADNLWFYGMREDGRMQLRTVAPERGGGSVAMLRAAAAAAPTL